MFLSTAGCCCRAIVIYLLMLNDSAGILQVAVVTILLAKVDATVLAIKVCFKLRFKRGTTKLNTDGCWNQTSGSAGFGGIFRDTKGDWILGYYGKLNCESSLVTEIWGIYRGLTIILEKSLTNIKIESDSIIVVEFINGGNSVNHPQRAMINDAHAIMVRTGITLNHTYREANQCADHLARIGAEQNEVLVVLMEQPLLIREFMMRDSLNLRQFLD